MAYIQGTQLVGFHQHHYMRQFLIGVICHWQARRQGGCPADGAAVRSSRRGAWLHVRAHAPRGRRRLPAAAAAPVCCGAARHGEDTFWEQMVSIDSSDSCKMQLMQLACIDFGHQMQLATNAFCLMLSGVADAARDATAAAGARHAVAGCQAA